MNYLALGLVAIALLLLAIDWRQTVAIFTTGRSEKNPAIRWLHAHKGMNGVHAWFAGWAVMGLFLALLLWRTDFIYPLAIGAALLEGYWVQHNFRNGVKP